MKNLNVSKKNRILFVILAATAAAIIALDQITKVLAVNAKDAGALPITLIKGVLSVSYVENLGGAFGSLAGSHILFFVLTILALPAFCALIFFRRNSGNAGCFALAMMFAGTVGNAIDRAFRGDGFFNGGVRDFIATECFGRLDSVFNVADISLVAGVALFIAALLFFDKDSLLADRRQRKKSQAESDKVEQSIAGGQEDDGGENGRN